MQKKAGLKTIITIIIIMITIINKILFRMTNLKVKASYPSGQKT